MSIKKKFKIIMRIIVVILAIWAILAQSCMRFRVSDEDAITDFSKAGVTLQSHTVQINGRHLHYVYCGADTLPTLVFIHGSPGSWNAFENYLKDTELLKHYQIISIDRPGFGYSDYGDAVNMDKQAKLIGSFLHQLKQRN